MKINTINCAYDARLGKKLSLKTLYFENVFFNFFFHFVCLFFSFE